MPFLNNAVTEYMNRQNAAVLREAMEALEEARLAPVRVIECENDARGVGQHGTWRGGARALDNYLPGTTEEDFNAKGITVYLASQNADANDICFPDSYRETLNYADWITEGTGRYAPDRNGLPTAELYWHGRTEAQILQIPGAVPLIHEGKCYGEMYDNGRCLFIYNGFRDLSGYGLVDWQTLVATPLLAAADPELRAKAEAEAKERAHKAFANMLKDRGDAALTEARQNRDKLAIEYAQLQERGVIVEGKLKGFDRQLAFYLDRHDDLNDELIEKEWNGITNNAKVKRFTAGEQMTEDRYDGTMINNPYLKIYTDYLWITSPDTKRVMPLGEYEVTMNFGTNELEIKNLTDPFFAGLGHGTQVNGEGTTRWDHPHVIEGRICKAQFATAITTMLRDRKLAAMTNMMFRILATCTTQGDAWGRNNILMWEAEDDKRREAKGWPAWTEGEEKHPLLIEMEKANA